MKLCVPVPPLERRCTMFRVLFFVTVMSLITETVQLNLPFGGMRMGMGGNQGGPLYSSSDHVYSLNATTIKEQIYGSSRGWLVEFYSSWCGHCVAFAPKWKQFAEDLAPWQNALVIAGIDCADETNVAICRDYEVMGYPSIRFFPPYAPMMKKIVKQGKTDEDLFRGEPIEKSENLGELKRVVIDKLAPHLHNFHAPDPATSPISDSVSLWDFIKKHTHPPETLPTYAFVVFETDKHPATKELAISLIQHPTVQIFQFTKKNPLYDALKLDGWPAAGYVRKDHTSGKLSLPKNQKIASNLLRLIAELAELSFSELTSTPKVDTRIKDEVKLEKEEAIANIIEEPGMSAGIISMEDLLHAVRNSLRNEVGLLKQIAGSKMQALKNYAHTLGEFFPADRRETMMFLLKFNAWLGPLEQIDYSTYMDKLNELELELHPWDIDANTWGNCKGSVPGRRGYPCGMWSLFHTLLAVANEKKQDFPVLDAIHGYMKEFFGCKECSGHFTDMVAEDGALMIKPIKDQLMWLWRAHNKVNLRLSGTLSEDPAYPKIIYPSETLCPDCYNSDEEGFDDAEVYKYLLNVYSKPERTLLPVKSNPDRIYSQQEGISKSSSFFSRFDYWLFCLVYLSVASLLILAYLQFRVRGRVDFSYIFCRKVKHHYLGKNNV